MDKAEVKRNRTRAEKRAQLFGNEPEIPPREGLGIHPGGGKMITKQADAETTDINAVVRRYLSQGVAPRSDRMERPLYGDFTASQDYLEARLRLDQAQADFESLPAEVRDRFDNDVAAFLDQVNADGPEGDELRQELFGDPNEGLPAAEAAEPRPGQGAASEDPEGPKDGNAEPAEKSTP